MTQRIPVSLSEVEQRQLNALAAETLDLSAEELGLVQAHLFYCPEEEAMSIEVYFSEGLELNDRHRSAIFKLLRVTSEESEP